MSIPSTFSALRKLNLLLSRKDKLKWGSIVVFALVTAFLEMLTAAVMMLFAQVLTEPHTGLKYLNTLGLNIEFSPGRMVFYMASLFGVIYLLKNVIGAAEVFYQNFSIQKMSLVFKEKLLNTYSNMDYSFYLMRNSTYRMAVIGDTDYIFSQGMMGLASILSEGLVFLFLIVAIIYVNPFLAGIIFVIGLVVGLSVGKGLLPIFYHWGKKGQEISLLRNQKLYQFLFAFKEIILMGKKDSFINAYQMYAKLNAKIIALQASISALPRMIIEVFFVGILIVTVGYLCLDHEAPNQMIGTLGGYLYTGFRLMPGLNRIINQLNIFKTTIPSIERVYDEYHEVIKLENYQNIPDFKFHSSIAIKEVCFSYPNTTKDILKKINFTIKKGECIGIVGETGSGKSTLVDLILGLLIPKSGSILIDGRYAAASYQWHGKIGYVPQAICLIDDTIEANIVFGEAPEEINIDRLKKAIHDAQLTKFINNLPQGLKTLVGERGVRLSGGERQRISIARALYRNPEVLIFDEATSALDNETEAKLMETIYSVSQNRTVIMIAHRLTTLKKCDRVISMSEGDIIKIEKKKKGERLDG